MNSMKMSIGEIIEELRLDAGFLQKDLAGYLHVSASTISHYESGVNTPDAATLSRLANFFGVSTDYLLGRTRLRMDWNTFKRPVRLQSGEVISVERVLALFLKLSDESQVDIVKLMNLYLLGDAKRHSGMERTVCRQRKNDLNETEES